MVNCLSAVSATKSESKNGRLKSKVKTKCQIIIFDFLVAIIYTTQQRLHLQSLLYLTRIYTQLGTDLHNNVSIVLFMFIITALVCEVIQPERLNAEGFSPSALSRGVKRQRNPRNTDHPIRKASE